VNKLLRTFIVFNAIVITLCLFAEVVALSSFGTPALLQFSEDHPIALRGFIVFVIWLNLILLVLRKRTND
jgi:hypothetical protein